MKVKFRTNRLTENIMSRFNSFLKDEKEVKNISEQLVRDLKTGYLKAEDPDGGPTKSISGKWDNRRKRLATKNQTSKYFNPASRNTTLTFTGQFIKSLKSSYQMGVKTLFIVEADGIHQRYIGIKGKPIGKAITNSKLFGYLSEWYGKTLVRISKESRNKIAQQFKEYLRRKR